MTGHRGALLLAVLLTAGCFEGPGLPPEPPGEIPVRDSISGLVVLPPGDAGALVRFKVPTTAWGKSESLASLQITAQAPPVGSAATASAVFMVAEGRLQFVSAEAQLAGWTLGKFANDPQELEFAILFAAEGLASETEIRYGVGNHEDPTEDGDAEGISAFSSDAKVSIVRLHAPAKPDVVHGADVYDTRQVIGEPTTKVYGPGRFEVVASQNLSRQGIHFARSFTTSIGLPRAADWTHSSIADGHEMVQKATVAGSDAVAGQVFSTALGFGTAFSDDLVIATTGPETSPAIEFFSVSVGLDPFPATLLLDHTLTRIGGNDPQPVDPGK